MHIRSSINQIFSQCGIQVNLEQSLPCVFEESVTNQFLKIQCAIGRQYLVRLNGQLWPPFTREGEDFNLHQLHSNYIFTHVIYNNYKEGFQICLFPDDSYRFDHVPMAMRSSTLFKNIGHSIKQVHKIKNFKDTYSLSTTINSGFNQVSKQASSKKLLEKFWMPVMSILSTIESDETSIVASHNDLLSSSVYCYANQAMFVDWEYSSMNYRSYDLALFSVKGQLSPEQEAFMLRGYDKEDPLNIYYDVTIMKPVIGFLLLQWHLAGKSPSLQVTKQLTDTLCKDLYKVELLHSFRLNTPRDVDRFFKAIDQKREHKGQREQLFYRRACL